MRDMDAGQWKIGLTLLLGASLAACGGTGGSLSVGKNAPNAKLAAAKSFSAGAAASVTATVNSLAIDAGGGGAVPNNWIADTGYRVSGPSGVKVVSNPIDTAAVTDPAPQAVYRTQRYAAHLTYSMAQLMPLAGYNVRLHFVESFFNARAKRVFSAAINGVEVLPDFDIFGSAGGANIAVVRTFAVNADPTGRIIVKLDASVNNATIAGIEVIGVAGTPPPAPLAAPTAGPAPTVSAQPGYGPRVPVGPQASITCPPIAANLTPGIDVQSIVNAHSAGTTYCLAAGTYPQQQIIPHDGDMYVGMKGATLDGQNIAARAFSGSAKGVTIKNLAIKGYNSAPQDAPIDPGMSGIATNWFIDNNEISSNASAGIDAGGGDHVVANYIHDNGQEGYKANGTGEVWTDNEISHNNPADANDPANEAGGGKAWQTTNLTMAYNFVHDNHGPGLWEDTDNQGTILEYNDVENNLKIGILHEISWDATIAHNYLRHNATGQYCPVRNYWCAEITIANSGGVGGKIIDVHDNTALPNGYEAAVMLYNEARGSGLYGSWLVQNVHVHRNAADLSMGGIIGAVDRDGSNAGMFTTQGNTFDYNAYAGAGSNAFYWAGTSGAFPFFRSSGEESHGTSQY
jgi:hypothetical protein